MGLASAIDGLPKPQRVLNDYNVSGLVLFFGGERTQVGIDGRADLYGSEYIKNYVDALALRGRWKATIEELAPTSALLEADSPAAQYLISQGWFSEGQEAAYLLLVAPPVN